MKQQLAPMYVYENPNTDPGDATKLAATATSVELKGTYKGKEYHKIIPFVTAKKVVEGALTGNEIIPIVRNYRYVVEILSSDENTLDFALKTTDWVDGKELDVKVDMEAPKIEDFTFRGNISWDETTLTADITKATTTAELSFTARGVRENNIAIEALYDENPDKLIDQITIDEGPLTGYADNATEGLSRSYTIKIPTRTGEFPVGFNVIVFNEKAKTVIRVKHTPFFVGGWESSRTEAIIAPAAQLIDLKNVPLGTTGTFSFFATSDSEITVSELTNKGITPDFYDITTTEDETDPAILSKYGPGKRVTLSYKAISEKTEFAEVTVTDASGEANAKKMFVKCLKAPYVVSMEVKPDATNTLAGEAPDTYYLAINGNEHGHNKYTVYAEQGQDIAYNPTATYATTLTNPSWVKDIMIPFDNVTETYADYQIVKRSITLVWPYAIKNPAAATNFTIGLAGEKPLHFIPVYPSGTGISEADKAFRPVLVKGIWWAPVNIGQTKLSVAGDPTAIGGHFFQWGRKQALTLATPTHNGAVDIGDPLIDQNWFIRTGGDWLKTPNNKLWNEGDETAPHKTSSDPCPAGWRIPTLTEFQQSLMGVHTWEEVPSPSASSNGCLTVSGESGAKLYFPAMGNFNENKLLEMVGTYGHYWLSTVDSPNGLTMLFSNASFRGPASKVRSKAMPVRCVQE